MSSEKCAWRMAGVLLLAFFTGSIRIGFPQSGETDVGEVAAFGGAVFGVGARPSVGGSTGVAFSRYGMFSFETEFISLGNRTIQSWPAPSTVHHSYLLDFGSDFHIRIPVRERWAPYFIAGGGLLWNLVGQNSTNRRGVAVMNHYDQFNAALHTGAGMRYYIREGWGIRPEFKVIVSKQTYYRLSVGFFYVLPSNWP